MRKAGALLAVKIRTAAHRCNGCNRRHRNRRRSVTAADFRRSNKNPRPPTILPPLPIPPPPPLPIPPKPCSCRRCRAALGGRRPPKPVLPQPPWAPP